MERCALLGFCWGAWLVCHACGSFNFCCGAMASLGVDCGPIIFVNGPLGWARENDDSIFLLAQENDESEIPFVFLGERERETEREREQSI